MMRTQSQRGGSGWIPDFPKVIIAERDQLAKTRLLPTLCAAPSVPPCPCFSFLTCLKSPVTSHVYIATKVFFPKPKECRLECCNDTRRAAEAFRQLWGKHSISFSIHCSFLPQINILFKQAADALRRRSVHKSSGADQNNGSHSCGWRSAITLVPSPEGTLQLQEHNTGTKTNLHNGFRVFNLKY